MAEEFEGKDFTDAVFWGVDLTNATFRDVNFTGARMKNVWLVDVDIDGLVDRLVVNGVDVTDFVNSNDVWYSLRSAIRPTDRAGLVAALEVLDAAWSATISRARELSDAQLHESVGGEWSFVQTQQHLVFGVDKWFSAPVLGQTKFTSLGLPNTGSRDFGWDGLDLEASPTLDEVLAVRDVQAQQLRTFVDTLTGDDIAREVEVLENGTAPIIECLYTIFEESFEHLRYAARDLDQLAGGQSAAS